jgi:hypothetical protein
LHIALKECLQDRMKVCFHNGMRKSAVIEFFDKSRAVLAAEIGISPQAVSDWPEELPRRISDRVIAAAVRAGRPIHLRPDIFDDAAAPVPTNSGEGQQQAVA